MVAVAIGNTCRCIATIEGAGMNHNADFSRRVSVHAATAPWVASPMPGVERRMLDRIGGEVARATSIVRYAPDSKFSAHVHSGGEEFLVLEGVFQDEHGDYPVGSYVRNPPQTSHTPGAAQGCTIFVKLWQFDPNDRAPVRIETANVAVAPDEGRSGVSACQLYKDHREEVRIEVWDANAPIALDVPGGIEVLVLDGSFSEGGEIFAEQSWLRLPKGSRLNARAGAHGARVWVKSGHLAEPPQAPGA